METNNIFGDRLYLLRKEKHMTQRDLAKMLAVSKVSISYYERGNRYPSVDKLVELADIFDVSLDYLMGRELVVENKNIKLSESELNILLVIKKDPELFKYIGRNTDRKVKIIKKKMASFIEADRLNDNYL